ncbi:MAG: cupredoxin domain-containing protein [bacterium]|nr:cupredoxin domain-containing protein [bacterium]
MKPFLSRAFLGLALAVFGFVPLIRAEDPNFTISIKDHIFTPNRLEVPANVRFKLIVINHDTTPEEFESYDLNREKIVVGGGQISLFIGPLEPGEYHYFGEFNPNLAKGIIAAR